MSRKNSAIAFLIGILFFLPLNALADLNVLQFTEDTSPATSDIIYFIKSPSATPLDRKLTFGNMIISLGLIRSGDNVSFGTISAGSSGFSVDSTGNITAKSVTVTRTDNPQYAQFYEATSDGNSSITLSVPAKGTGLTANRTLYFQDGDGKISYTVASGTASLGTSAIASGACATVVSVAGTGIFPGPGACTGAGTPNACCTGNGTGTNCPTDVISWGFNGDPTSTTGYSPSANGMLTIIAYPTSGYSNFRVCNNTGSSITPGAITLNWKDIR